MKIIRLALVASAFAAAQAARGNSYSVIKIADTNTPIPSGSGHFTNFSTTSGGTFIGEGNNGQEGIYFFAPGVTGVGVLAYAGMAAPGFGNGVDFASFVSVSDGYQGQTFVATTTTGAQAVYDNWRSGEGSNGLMLIAETGQSPSTGIVFNSFTSVSSTDQVNEPLTPTGEFLSNAGIYYFSVTLPGGEQLPPYSSYSVAFTQEATSTPASAFTALGQPNFKAGFPGGGRSSDSTIQTMRAIFSGIEGIYYSQPNGPSAAPDPFAKLVDSTTAVPNGTGDFTSFGDPTASENDIIFTAHYDNAGSDEQGLFSWGPYFFGPPSQTPALQELLAGGTVAPGSGGAHFKDFLGVTPQGTFLADLDNGTQGIYLLGSTDASNSTSTIGDVIDTTGTLDGKAIRGFEMSREADVFSSSAITAFIVNFTNGSQGLYYYSLPEPASVYLLALAVLTIVRRKRCG